MKDIYTRPEGERKFALTYPDRVVRLEDFDLMLRKSLNLQEEEDFYSAADRLFLPRSSRKLPEDILEETVRSAAFQAVEFWKQVDYKPPIDIEQEGLAGTAVKFFLKLEQGRWYLSDILAGQMYNWGEIVMTHAKTSDGRHHGGMSDKSRLHHLFEDELRIARACLPPSPKKPPFIY